MKSILVMSISDCFDYVVHQPTLSPYIIISIQDSQNGFGLEFIESRFCKGVLTLYFDDISQAAPGLTLFTTDQALKIISFLKNHKDIPTIVIHCYAGESRSAAVASVISSTLYDNALITSKCPPFPNMHVHKILIEAITKYW